MKLNRVKILALITILFSLGCKEKLSIINDALYAIGYVDFYTPQYRSNLSSINFHYFVDSKSVANGCQNTKNGWTVPANAYFGTGEMFMLHTVFNNGDVVLLVFLD